MRKRFVPLLLVMALALSLAAPAGAAGVANPSLLLSVSEGQAAAEKLHTMGLFQGVGTNADGTPDFALDRTPTRIEGVTILVRLLGKEQNARWSTAQIPFVDVPNWGAALCPVFLRKRLHQGHFGHDLWQHGGAGRGPVPDPDSAGHGL